MIRAYPHSFEPEGHPDYERRGSSSPRGYSPLTHPAAASSGAASREPLDIVPTRADGALLRQAPRPVTRADLGNQVQFTSLRVFSINAANRLVNFEDDLDLYANRLGIGKVVWPFNKALFADNLADLADEVARRGYWLFDFWGYVPGSDPDEQAWGQYSVPRETLERLVGKLGRRFLGMDNGEQDGRYIGGYAPSACPVPTDRGDQVISFYRHFRRMGDDLGDRISILCSLNFPHYFARQGSSTILGAETAQGLINANLWYAYIRGAGKQYGLLWFGNASIWNRWGYKSYESCGGEGDYTWGPDSGTSLSLLRRLLYSEYQYNCDILGFEQSWVLGDNTEKRIQGLPTPMDTDESTKVLTPVGDLQVEAARRIGRWGYAGPMHTPVAILLHWSGGWVPPRHLYTGRTHLVWGGVPYAEGDFQLHALFSMLYPGYEDSGFFRNERGFLTATPHTDCADVLFTDAREATLATYNVVLMAGEHSIDAELADKLSAFVAAGGTLALFGQALEELPARARRPSAPAGPDGLGFVAVLAEGRAALKQGGGPRAFGWGAGRLLVLAEGYGLVPKTPLPGAPLDNRTDESLPRYFDFTDGAAAAIAELLDAERIVWADNPALMTVVNLTSSPTRFVVGVSNPSQVEQAFTLATAGGVEWHVCEALLADGLAGLPEPATESTGPTAEGGPCPSGPHMALAPGGIAMLSVELSERTYTPKEKCVHLPVSRTLRCSIGRPVSLSESLLLLPTFHHWFDGALVDGRYLDEHDAVSLAAEGRFCALQGICLTIDLTGMVNLFPDLTLIDNIRATYAPAMERLDTLVAKAAALRADSIVLGLHRVPENHSSLQQTLEASGRAIARLCGQARSHGIRVYLQHGPGRPASDPQAMAAYVDELVASHSLDNLRFAYSTGHAAMSGTAEPAPPAAGMVLVSAPSADAFGQFMDCHGPVTGSKWEGVMVRHARSLAEQGAIVCIDQPFSSWDSAYLEARSLLPL